MKTFSAVATLIAFFGVNSVYAGCYSGGDAWQDAGAARSQAQSACETGAFSGHFAAGESKSACFQLTGTQRVDFVVQNLNTGSGYDLAHADCTLRLQNEINGCSFGGESDVSGWHFKSDPSNGVC
ncbi:hypothetical protein F5Y15DRAFT_421014 [Xylariaceae sp. FL0016]|nr:hypothetical protein F5Y15DRAFT_421014 [Xylariaceae sp. FL0016]